MKDYEGMFDVYYCNNYDFLLQHFDLGKFPAELPEVIIVDPKDRVEINEKQSYPKKYIRPLMEPK